MATMESGLTIVMVMGAALEESAKQHKEAEFRSQIVPLLPQFKATGDPKPLIEVIKTTLGEDWMPEGQWADYILKLNTPKDEEAS